MIKETKVSEKRACEALGQHRSTQRKKPQGRADEGVLTRAIIYLASKLGRYDYRRIHWLLEQDAWRISLSRVKRIWRREGFKAPSKQPKHGPVVRRKKSPPVAVITISLGGDGRLVDQLSEKGYEGAAVIADTFR